MDARITTLFRSATVSVVALVLLGTACTQDDPAAADTTPKDDPSELVGDVETGEPDIPAGEDWEVVDPESAGMDPTVLEEVAAEAEAGLSNCLLVTRGGKIVDEHYWQGTGPDTAQETFSASKSFTATLIGMASDEGAISVQDKASKWIPEWQGTPSEDITVEQLLSNTSGRYQDFQSDYVEMAAKAQDKTAFAIGLDQQHEPGSTWVYNNAAIQTLEQVFSEATGQDLSEFATERLFAPIGMDHSEIARDAAGNPMTFMGVQSTCRDMARFGTLALNRGEWNGEQIVSEDWMQRSTGRSSQELNSAYGWLWWLNRKGPVLAAASATGESSDATAEDQLVPGAPEEMFFASGLGGQTIAVDPGTETVVVRLGPATYPEGIEKFERKDVARISTEGVIGDTTY